MTEDQKPLAAPTESRKVYSARKICTGSYLGGPLAAGYMLTENFKALGERGKIFNTWVVTVTLTVLILLMPLLLNVERVPGLLVPLIYTLAAYIFFRIYQEDKTKTHVRAGGEFFGWGKTTLVALVSLLISLAFILPFAYFAGDFSETATVKTYGRLKHDISFEKANISETEVNGIAEALTKTSFFDNEKTKSVDVKKVGTSYELNLYCNDSIKTNREAIDYFRTLQTDVQKSFPDNKIIFNLVVETPENVVKRLE
jgi:hypothetical protein